MIGCNFECTFIMNAEIKMLPQTMWSAPPALLKYKTENENAGHLH